MAAKVAKKTLKKMPTAKQMEALKKDDKNYVSALEDSVTFLDGRQQAIYAIARKYHLDRDELYQEAYETLLTCLRDFTPVFQQASGKIISVQFTTFFGSRLETRAMELRNRDPEYQARAAYINNMSDDEKEAFRKDPPLLVQHLDHELNMHDGLENEVYESREGSKTDVAMKILRDSFFEKKIEELVERETDEKKRAALMYVKVGGVYNFQEIAYHFGVTDSRASQVMNELMDAFYIQRMIDGSIESVAHDFEKLKFNDKRVIRLVSEAVKNSDAERGKLIGETFNGIKGLDKALQAASSEKDQAKIEEKKPEKKRASQYSPPSYEDIFTDEDDDKYPLVGVEVRSNSALKFLDMPFRPLEIEENFDQFLETFDAKNNSLYPALVTEDGVVLDGEWRLRAAKEQGVDSYVCITRRVRDPLEQKILRIKINHAIYPPKKIDLYYAIGVLSDEGMSQQKIADALGTSRTNVLVYVKVRDKASLKMRALYEDGLIQITNASNCADLEEEEQDRIAAFIRKYGIVWSKGAKFNELFAAIHSRKIDSLEAKLSKTLPDQKSVEVSSSALMPQSDNKLVSSLQSSIKTYEQSLKDNEVWAAQREGVITNLREELDKVKADSEGLKKELDAAELMKFGNPKAIEEELENLKRFYGITERLSGATHSLKKASRDINKVPLKRKQVVEIDELMDSLEEALNTFRVTVASHKKA